MRGSPMTTKLSLLAITAVLALGVALHSEGGTAEAGCDDGQFWGVLPAADGGGWGQFVFCGGTFDELLEMSGCSGESAVFFYNKADGTFATWVAGAQVAAVNEEIAALFPNAVVSGELGEVFNGVIPASTIFTARC